MNLLRQGFYPLLSALAVGGIGVTTFKGYPVQSFTAQADSPKTALDPNNFIAFKLTEREKLTQNTWRFRFQLPNDKTAGLTVASCLVTRAMVPGESKPVIRPYTPTSPPDAKGYMDLVVKVYENGKMSKHIGSLQVGDTLDMKGPIPKLPYKPNMVKKMGMVAGGTGITPMLQVIDAILANPEDKTEISLVYASISEDDIIFKDKLDALAAKHKNLKILYVVDKAKFHLFPTKYGVGHINKDMLSKHLPAPSPDTLVLVCGPPGMMNVVSGNKAPDYTQGEVSGILKELGYTQAQVFKF